MAPKCACRALVVIVQEAALASSTVLSIFSSKGPRIKKSRGEQEVATRNSSFACSNENSSNCIRRGGRENLHRKKGFAKMPTNMCRQKSHIQCLDSTCCSSRKNSNEGESHAWRLCSWPFEPPKDERPTKRNSSR